MMAQVLPRIRTGVAVCGLVGLLVSGFTCEREGPSTGGPHPEPPRDDQDGFTGNPALEPAAEPGESQQPATPGRSGGTGSAGVGANAPGQDVNMTPPTGVSGGTAAPSPTAGGFSDGHGPDEDAGVESDAGG